MNYFYVIIETKKDVIVFFFHELFQKIEMYVEFSSWNICWKQCWALLFLNWQKEGTPEKYKTYYFKYLIKFFYADNSRISNKKQMHRFCKLKSRNSFIYIFNLNIDITSWQLNNNNHISYSTITFTTSNWLFILRVFSLPVIRSTSEKEK